MRYNTRYKIAAVIALLIGMMSVLVGTRVLMGMSTPEYHVMDWLVVYNVFAGIISIAVSILIWKEYWRAFTASVLIAASHIIVLVLLILAFNEITAIESIKAMTFRSTIWIIIILLSIKPKNQTKSK